MPNKKQISKQDNERLSELIRLKRSEKPDEAFWEKFDEDLRSKQLSALVETHTWYARTGKLSLLLAKKSAAVLATGGALALTFLAINPLQVSETPSTPTAPVTASLETEDVIEAPLFVVDSQNTIELSQPATTLDSQIKEFSLPATYGINVLSPDRSDSSFKLNTQPKTFTTSNRQSSSEQTGFGAQIIRSKTPN
ncbi:hypothetical protein MLD52_02625 [Puniceicoccaceae bacterium K14]|nr:hypothetical protein [Puniceicoccaceae bacterium K14]